MERDSEAWRAVLQRLSADKPALVEDFLVRLGEQGSYADALVTHDDLRIAASQTMDMLLALLADERLTGDLDKLPATLGARRARQGVPRESLLDAVRLDFRVLWAGLLRALGDAPASVLVDHAEDVLEIVERYIGDVQAAFLSEQNAMARDTRVYRSRALGRLLIAEPPDRAMIASEECLNLGWALDGSFDVLFLRTRDLDAARASLDASGDEVVTWDWGDTAVVVRESKQTALPDIDAGCVEGVQGLAAVPEAVEVAREVLRVSRPGAGVMREADTWSAVVYDRASPFLPSVAAVSTSLLALDHVERARLIDTVKAYCGRGSVKTAAADLFVHRNTVVNRLTAFNAATGLDVTLPVDAARALIGLADPRLITAGPRGRGLSIESAPDPG